MDDEKCIKNIYYFIVFIYSIYGSVTFLTKCLYDLLNSMEDINLRLYYI